MAKKTKTVAAKVNQEIKAEETPPVAVEKVESVADADKSETATVEAAEDSAENTAAAPAEILDGTVPTPRKKRIPNWVWALLIILFNVLIWVMLPRHR